MRPLFSSVTLIAFVSTPAFLFAQSNLIQNPGFEKSTRTANVWAGISRSGIISAPTESANVLGATGEITGQTMPPSVSAGDLNNDGLNDIGIMDGRGFLRVHFNIGTKQEPKFGPAELSSLLLNPQSLSLSAAEQDDKDKVKDKPKPAPKGASKEGDVTNGIFIEGFDPVADRAKVLGFIFNARRVQRINFANLSRTGKLDLLVGNYNGDVLLIPNSGAPNRPDFRTPATYESALLQKGPERWGNIFAPYAVDWDKDNKVDLLIGEGSYSANSIHIFPGKGIGRPSLEPDDRSVLAYGMGLEQLSPCVVDYNGDGNNDLLVAEREGRIAVYLGKGGPFKPGEAIPFHSFITIDGAAPALPPPPPAPEPGSSLQPMDAIKATNLLKAGGVCTIDAADYNGDGLFDLVFGIANKEDFNNPGANGRVAMSINQGTATEPKFKAPVNVKVEAEEKPFFVPSDWEFDFGYGRGNFGGYITVIKSDPANSSNASSTKPQEGSSFLEAGYINLNHGVMPPPTITNSGDTDDGRIRTPNIFTFSQPLTTALKVGKTYVLSFKVKGAQIIKGSATVFYQGQKVTGTGEVTRGDRGEVKKNISAVNENKNESVSFTGTPNWVEVKKEFTVKFDNKGLQDVLETLLKKDSLFLRFVFQLTPGSGIAQFDDIKLVEK